MPPAQMLLSWRLLILSWLNTWITAVPLFHIHIPDATDDWSALHSGGPHTVVTPDLPGEFSRPLHDSPWDHSARLSHRIINSPELGLALLDEKSSTDKLYGLGALYHVLDKPLPSLVTEFPEQLRRLLLSQSLPPCRASPRTVCA
jgi:hypothetical protein